MGGNRRYSRHIEQHPDETPAGRKEWEGGQQLILVLAMRSAAQFRPLFRVTTARDISGLSFQPFSRPWTKRGKRLVLAGSSEQDVLRVGLTAKIPVLFEQKSGPRAE
jgi:hypothetical protein